MSKDKDKNYTIEHVTRFRERFQGVEERIIAQAYEDGRDVVILLPKDVGASAQSYAMSLQAKIAELGFTVRLVKPKLDKVTRFGAFAAMAEALRISYVEDEWNKDYFIRWSINNFMFLIIDYYFFCISPTTNPNNVFCVSC